MTRTATVTQAMIDRAVRVAERRGLTVTGIELEVGKVRILTGSPIAPSDPLEAWRAKKGKGNGSRAA